MKIILSILLLVCIGCNNDKKSALEGIYKAENEKHYPSNHDPDTSISQWVWLWKNSYVLQTVVQTERQQTHLSNHTEFEAFLETDSYAPYNKEIVGSFNFIKSNKLIEYNKADSFIKDLRLKAARDSIAFKATLRGKMIDSAKILNTMPLYGDSIIKTDNRALDGISTDKGVYKYENNSK